MISLVKNTVKLVCVNAIIVELIIKTFVGSLVVVGWDCSITYYNFEVVV
jgi:hypothetical protein